MKSKSTETKPSIVFCHGIWADGSCFNKVIPTLQADGHQVIAAQYGLDSLASDVATVKRTLGRVSSPAILVGHSYGGSVITAAGTDDLVVGLVYIAALAPDADETSQSQQDKFPRTDVFSYVEVVRAENDFERPAAADQMWEAFRTAAAGMHSYPNFGLAQ